MKSLLTITIMLMFLSLSAEIILNHIPPMNSTESLLLSIDSGSSEISKIQLFYKEANDAKFNMKELDLSSLNSGTLKVNLPNSMKEDVAYYFIVTSQDGSILSLPETNPESNPYRLYSTKKSSNNGFVKLSPDDNKILKNDELVIAISYFTIAKDIDTNSLQFFLNGKNETSKATITDNLLMYKDKIKSNKDINFYVSGKLKNGKAISSKVWKISVINLSKIELPLNISGSISYRSFINSTAAEDENSTLVNDNTDKFAGLTFKMSGRQNFFKFDTNIYLSSRNSSTQQTVNRYRLNMSIPHLKLTLGDYSPKFNDFTLSGTNINGVYSELNFKYFRLKSSLGKTLKSIENDNNPNLSSFERNTVALRTEFGNVQKLNFGLSFVKTKDDVESIDEQYYKNTNDSTYFNLAKDNLVMGADVNWKMLNNSLVFGAESAMSLYNSNINDGVLSEQELSDDYGIDDLPFNPEDYENIIVINQNFEPFTPGKANLAYKAYARVLFKRNLLNISFSEVGASFNSLTSSYLQKDTRTIAITDAWSFWQNKITLSGGINLRSDNLSDQKESTNSTTNYFINAIIRPDNFPYFSLSMNNTDSENDASTNQISNKQNSQLLNFGIGYNFKQIEFSPTSVSINYSSVNSDFNQDSNTSNIPDFTTENQNNRITITSKSKLRDLPMDLTMGFSIFNEEVKDSSINTDKIKNSYNSFNFSTDWRFLNDALTPFVGFKVITFTGDNNNDKSQKMLFLGSGYQLFEDTFISSDINYKTFNDDNFDDLNYSNFTWNLNFSQKF